MVKFDVSENILLKCKDCEDTNINTPSGVTIIGESAFTMCKNLKMIIIRKGVITIGKNAFFGLDKLESVSIPSTVTSIEESAFEGCKSLIEIKLPENRSYF